MNTKRFYMFLTVIAMLSVLAILPKPIRANSPSSHSPSNAPSIVWNTFWGEGQTAGDGVLVDANGNVYIVGYGSGTWGNPINGPAGMGDASVAKFDSSGMLQWNTFLGSSTDDQGFGIALDGGGNVYVSGRSLSTWGTPVNNHAGGGWHDTFVAKLDNDGTLLWNTFLGSAGPDQNLSITADENGNSYVVGNSNANWGNPVVPHAGGGLDGFVAKLNTYGELQWNTFVGSASNDSAAGIAVDNSGNIYITGDSSSTWGNPVNPYVANDRDGFVAKLDSSGVLVWNTFLGGNRSWGRGMTLDEGGNTYIVGYSEGTWGDPMNAYAGGGDTFAAKFDNNGVLMWNTFFGSTGFDAGFGITLDGNGNAYAVGDSSATWGNPAIGYAGGGRDVFIAKLSSNGSLKWNTFLGSTGYDQGMGVAADGSENVYVTGYSGGTWGTPLHAHPGGADILFVAKLAGNLPPANCPSDMISYWPFNESNGQIANDMVDGRLLTLGTSSGIDSQDPNWTTGNFEGALMFDGVNDLVRGGSLPQMSEGTIEAWVNRTSYGNYPNPIIFGLFRPGTYIGAIFILQADSNIFGTKIFEWVKMDSSNKQIRLVTQDNAWEYNHSYHIVATWGSSGMKFYINGVLADSTIYYGEAETSNPTTDFIGSTAPIEIGDYIAYGHAGWQPFAGTIDEVAVYDTALTSAEVQQHYQNGLNGHSYCEQPPADATPPTIVPTIGGIEGNSSWYIGDVTVSWDVSDPESGIASSVGCDMTTLATDTTGETLTCSATNGSGLSNSASVTVKIDKTPPTIVASATTDPNAADWYKDDVTVHFTCNDALSGIPADTCPLDQILSAEGTSVASTAQTVADAAGNTSGDSNVVTVSIDKTAPTITWDSSIIDGDSFHFGFVPSAPTCTASDSLSGMDGACVVNGYATTVGSHLLTAIAKDNAGNQATENRIYTVLAWTLTGFFQPVDMNGVYNVVKNGSTVPFKFEIFAGSLELTDIAFIKSLTYAQTSCDASAITDDIETTATGGTSLRYDAAAGQFVYNWKVPNTAGKCYRVTLTTFDGSTLVAYFKLK